MRLIGLLMVVGGWLIAVSGLFFMASNKGRAIIACVGIAVTLFGMLKVLNGYYLERAIWKK